MKDNSRRAKPIPITRQQSQPHIKCLPEQIWNGTECVTAFQPADCTMITEWNGDDLGREYCVDDIQFLQDFACANCLGCPSDNCPDNPYAWCIGTPSRACYKPLEIGYNQEWSRGGRLTEWNHNGYYNDDIWEGFVPDSISNLTELKKLWLQYNELQGAIPESFCEIFPNLETFFIFSNNFCPPYPSCLTEEDIGYQDCEPAIETWEYYQGWCSDGTGTPPNWGPPVLWPGGCACKCQSNLGNITDWIPLPTEGDWMYGPADCMNLGDYDPDCGAGSTGMGCTEYCEDYYDSDPPDGCHSCEQYNNEYNDTGDNPYGCTHAASDDGDNFGCDWDYYIPGEDDMSSDNYDPDHWWGCYCANPGDGCCDDGSGGRVKPPPSNIIQTGKESWYFFNKLNLKEDDYLIISKCGGTTTGYSIINDQYKTNYIGIPVMGYNSEIPETKKYCTGNYKPTFFVKNTSNKIRQLIGPNLLSNFKPNQIFINGQNIMDHWTEDYSDIYLRSINFDINPTLNNTSTPIDDAFTIKYDIKKGLNLLSFYDHYTNIIPLFEMNFQYENNPFIAIMNEDGCAIKLSTDIYNYHTWYGNLKYIDISKSYYVISLSDWKWNNNLNVHSEVSNGRDGTSYHPISSGVDFYNLNRGINFISSPTTPTSIFNINHEYIKSVYSEDGYVRWNDELSDWVGGFKNLEPSKGYLFNSPIKRKIKLTDIILSTATRL